MKKEIVSNSASFTSQIGERLGRAINTKTVIAFKGGLGAGKTCFTRGLARGLGFKGSVTSPTFAIINEYSGGRLNLYHFDMYRVTGWEDLYSTGYFDYLDAGGVIAAEWSENITSALPQNTIYVSIEKICDEARKITITGVDLT